MKMIYLTDDDEEDRMLIRIAIEKEVSDVVIIELDSGEALIQTIMEEKYSNFPSVIIVDMNMPRMNGIETVSLLKADARSKHIPVVMLSTTSNTSLIQQAYGKGINAFLEKPILVEDFARLAEAIDVCFFNTSRHVESTLKSSSHFRHIIVIEDNKDHLYFIRKALEKCMPNAEIHEYFCSQKIISDIAEKWLSVLPHPQLILMDLYMPTRQRGLDLLIKIQQLLVSKSVLFVPIVIFTNSNDPEDRKASYQLNANAFMVKDLDMLHWQNHFKNLHNFTWDTLS